MADPTPYERTYSFTDFQAGNPSAPLPGIQVDNELENVEQSLGEAIDAIKDIRRSDGALKNGIVTVDSLDPTVAAGVGAGALASAAAAAASADAASDSAVAAAASATAASGSATAASGYASNALTSRNEAETEKTLAQTARTGAQTARDFAYKWATEAEDVEVDDDVNPPGYSAYHWAQVALEAATGGLDYGIIGEAGGIEIQRHRGTTAQHASYTGPIGEITVDTTKKTVVVHDGVTAGGVPMAREDFTATAGALTVMGDLIAEGDDLVETDLAVKAYSTGTPVIHGYKATGTKEAPGAAPNGSMLLGIGSRPYIGSGFSPHSTAALHFIARELQSATAMGTSLRFLVTPLGADDSFRKEVLRLESDGAAAGTRVRFKGNGTLADRMYFQSEDAAGHVTSVGILPSSDDATANSAVNFFNKIDPANAGLLQVKAGATKAEIIASQTGTGATLPLGVSVGGAERLYWSTTGRAFINCQAPLSYYSSDTWLTIRSTPGSVSALRLETDSASGTLALFVTNAGLAGTIFSSGTATTFNTSSDYRMKEEAGDNIDYWNRIESVSAYSFTWKTTGERDRGFFAHEFATAYPRSVNGEKDAIDDAGNPVHQTMQASTPEVMADIFSALQDLQKRLQALEATAA